MQRRLAESTGNPRASALLAASPGYRRGESNPGRGPLLLFSLNLLVLETGTEEQELGQELGAPVACAEGSRPKPGAVGRGSKPVVPLGLWQHPAELLREGGTKAKLRHQFLLRGEVAGTATSICG